MGFTRCRLHRPNCEHSCIPHHWANGFVGRSCLIYNRDKYQWEADSSFWWCWLIYYKFLSFWRSDYRQYHLQRPNARQHGFHKPGHYRLLDHQWDGRHDQRDRWQARPWTPAPPRSRHRPWVQPTTASPHGPHASVWQGLISLEVHPESTLRGPDPGATNGGSGPS